MRGPKAELTIHSVSGTTVDGEGLWDATYTDVEAVGVAMPLKISEEIQTANQDWARERIVILVPPDVPVLMDDEITVTESPPGGNMDGRYKVRGVRSFRLHTRVLAHDLSAE